VDDESAESTAELEARRRKELRKVNEQRDAAQHLVVYLDACNVDALVSVARNSLDALKQRIITNAGSSSGTFCSFFGFIVFFVFSFSRYLFNCGTVR